MRVQAFKRTVMATSLALFTVVAGITGEARAFNFSQGDLVLAIFGNETEALYNLGSASTILGGSGISNMDVSAGLSAASVGTLSNVRYTVFGITTALDGVYAATSFSPGGIVGATDFNSQLLATANMLTLINFTGDTIGKNTTGSFTSFLNTTALGVTGSLGTGTMEGSWPVAMYGQLDQSVNLMNGTVSTNTFTQVGSGILTAQGLFSLNNQLGPVAPVPLPAGVILFGTGLAGLVGIARRSLGRVAA